VTRSRLRESWDSFWYRPEAAENLAAARVLLAATALWVVLSRFDLPSIVGLPPELLSRVTPERRLRFFMLFGVGTERVLYGLLHLSLLGGLLGVAPRVSCLLSGLLLYHFAPFETIIRTGNPYLRGLTIPTLGLLILAFSTGGPAFRLFSRAQPAPPSVQRWPLALVQVLFVQIYFFAGYSKLFTSGLAWATAANVRGHLLVINQILVEGPEGSLASLVAGSPLACAVLAASGLVLELVFPVVLFSRKARRFLLPLAFLFHVGNSVLFRIFFQNVGLLLLFVDWSRLWPRTREAA
jgi:hypothetical protein